MGDTTQILVVARPEGSRTSIELTAEDSRTAGRGRGHPLMPRGNDDSRGLLGAGPGEQMTDLGASCHESGSSGGGLVDDADGPGRRLRNFEDESVSDYEREIDIAHALVSAGVPIITAKPVWKRQSRDWTGGTGGSGYWLPHGWQTAEPDQSEVDRWRPGDGLLMVTGHGLDVIDVDPRNGGDGTYAGLAEAGCLPRILATAQTPSGGQHHLVRSLGMRKCSLKGVDIQAGDTEGHGRGFVWLAPTRKRAKAGPNSGEVVRYRWTRVPDPASLERLAEDDLDDGADALRSLVADRRPVHRATPAADVPHSAFADASNVQRQLIDRYLAHRLNEMRERFDEYAGMADGWRNESGHGWERLVADAAFDLGRLARSDWSPWSLEDARQHFESVVPTAMRNAAGIGDKWASQAMRGDPTPFPGHMSIPTPSDTTSSAALPTGSTGDVFDPSTVAHPQVQATEWFAGRHGGEFLHVQGLGWHWWDDRRWAEDVGDIRVRRALRDTLAERLSAAVGGGDEYKRLIEVVTGCQTKNGMTSVLWHASFDEAFSADVAELDADPYLLNVANGTLDLRTLELREHNPKDRMTKITSGAYRHGLTSTEWEKFTARVLPDDGARGYLQRYLGLSLCGQALEHVFTIAIGTGANGKGTLRTAVAAALGDYHHEAPASLFLESKRNSGEANADLIALRGRRFVVASETDEGVRLSVSLMKQISGGDPITARRPYATASVTFPSSWTVLLVTNHLPKVPADDEAVWRRMRVVPFDEVIPEDERDGTLSEKLVAEVDAVITWLVDGWRDYRSRMTTGNPQGRLDEPRAVQQRTTLYRADSDNVARFVADECIADPTAVTSSDALWDRWVSWSMGQRIPRVDRSVFGQRLIALGFESKRSAKSRGYAGLELRHHPQE